MDASSEIIALESASEISIDISSNTVLTIKQNVKDLLRTFIVIIYQALILLRMRFAIRQNKTMKNALFEL